MKGYVEALQWYSRCKTLDELCDPSQHTGDAAAITQILGPMDYPIRADLWSPAIGSVIFRVEDDDTLTLVRANYDSSG